jgi:hypothetical protein
MKEKRMKAAASQAVSYRNYRRARDRALTRLAQAYPDDYKELLEQEKAIDETQGRKWIDIDGNTNTVGVRPTITPIADVRETSNGSQDQGDNGGKE